MRRTLALIPLALLTAGVGGAIALAATDSPQPAPLATSTTTTSTTPFPMTSSTRPTELHVFPDVGTGSSIPAFCSFGYPSNHWPPPPAPALAAHLLKVTDVPAGMVAFAPTYPSNGPNFDEIAVGYPQDPMVEADFATPHTTEPASVTELLTQARSPGAAAAQVRFAVDKVYAECEAGGIGYQFPTFALPQSDQAFTAFEELSGTSYDNGVAVVVLGAVGEYVFEVSVGNLITYPDTRTAAVPTEAEVVAVLQATTARLRTADTPGA